MKKELLTILAVLLVVAFCAADITSWTGKTPAQLSGMQDYATIPNTAYWNSHAYLQIYDMLTIINQESDGRRSTKGYASLKACIYNNTDTCVTGTIVGESNFTETISGITHTHIYVASNTHIIMPPSYKVDYYKTTGDILVGGGLFFLDGVENVIIEGGELDGNAANNGHQNEHMHAITINGCKNVWLKNINIHDWSGDGVLIQNSSNIIIENCIINNPNIYTSESPHLWVGRDGVTIVVNTSTTPHDSTVHDIFINNNVFTGGDPACIDIEPDIYGKVYNIYIANNTFRADSLYNNPIGVEITSTISSGGITRDPIIENIIVHSNNFKGHVYGIEVNGSGMLDNRMRNIRVTNNIIDSTKTYGVYVAGAEDVQIEGNTISNTFNPDTTSAIGILVVNCNQNNSVEYNKVINTGNSGIFISNANMTQVVGNTVRNVNYYALSPSSDAGIVISHSDTVEVRNNYIYTFAAPDTQTYGIVCDNAAYLNLEGNVIRGCADNTIHTVACTNVTQGINHFADSLHYGDLYGQFCTGPAAPVTDSTFLIFSTTPGDTLPLWDKGLANGEIHANHGISYGVLWSDRGFLRLSAGGQVDSTRKAGIDINAYSDVAKDCNVIQLKPRGTSVLTAYSDRVILPAGVILGGSWTVGTDSMQIDSAKVTGGKLKFYIGGKIYAISEEAL